MLYDFPHALLEHHDSPHARMSGTGSFDEWDWCILIQFNNYPEVLATGDVFDHTVWGDFNLRYSNPCESNEGKYAWDSLREACVCDSCYIRKVAGGQYFCSSSQRLDVPKQLFAPIFLDKPLLHQDIPATGGVEAAGLRKLWRDFWSRTHSSAYVRVQSCYANTRTMEEIRFNAPLVQMRLLPPPMCVSGAGRCCRNAEKAVSLDLVLSTVGGKPVHEFKVNLAHMWAILDMDNGGR